MIDSSKPQGDPGETTPVLVVDDDADLRASLVQLLSLAGYRVVEASGGAAALDQVGPDFGGPVVSDVRMPGMDGIELLDRLTLIDRDLPVILLTGHGDVPMAVAALRAGAWDFLTKPFDPDRLTAAVARAAEQRRLVLENRDLRDRALRDADTSPIIGRSPAMERLRQMLDVLADTPIDLIVEGESGTGKELAARTLHHLSPGTGRFLALSCSGLTEAMAQADLFAPDGPIAAAQGGTLFLDDVHRAGPLLQARLAGFAETRVLGAAGSDAARAVECRIVATVPDRGALDRIDKALLYRLSGMHLEIPPLRDRREDIALLLAHGLDQAARTFRRDRVRPGRPALDWATAHDWPGNVRELESYAERLTLGLEDAAPQAADSRSLPERLDAFERAEITAALAATGGHVAAAIDRLGIPRKTFYYKTGRLGIDPAAFRNRRG